MGFINFTNNHKNFKTINNIKLLYTKINLNLHQNQNKLN